MSRRVLVPCHSLTLSPELQASATAGGGVVITDASGKEQFSFDPPTMVDASGAEGRLRPQRSTSARPHPGRP